MRVRCFEIKQTGGLEPVEAKEATDRWRAGDGAFWIDVDSYQAADLRELLAAFDLSSLAKERCLDIGKATHIVPLPDYAFLEITVFSDNQFSQTINDVRTAFAAVAASSA